MIFQFVTSLSIVLLCLQSANSDIVGCGGFLKSPVAIDFSKVDVKLLTPQGVQKDSTDCAPTNGYYFIPLYDKGKYVLKVSPPSGWFFEPHEFQLSFDGVSDPCTTGKDINFDFKGFAVSGKVTSRGSEHGPEGVAVTLKSLTGSMESITVRTTKNGAFEMAPVLPGKYQVTADHPTLLFEKKSAEVTVTSAAAELPNDLLVVSGYDVSGTVVSNKEPAMGVTMILYPSGQSKGVPAGCNTSPLSDVPRGALCHVTTDSSGKFLFSAVPSGKYVLRPYYATFEVLPKEIEFTVGLEPVNLQTKFVIKGFSVRGSVVVNKGGRGLANVDILVGNERVTTTDDRGNFLLDGMEPATYILSAKSEDFEFSETEVKISPSTPELEPLVPVRVRVCGRVVSVTPDSVKSVEIVSLARTGEQPVIISVRRNTGEFCQFLARGRYKLSASGTHSSQFLPASREITVADQVVTGIEFQQLRATVRGRLVRLPRPITDRTFSVSLQQDKRVIQVVNPGPSDDMYTFRDVPPGTYDIAVESGYQCFEPLTQSVSVTSAEVSGPAFGQTGYVMRIFSSHPVTCNIKTLEGEKVSSKNLVKGSNSICLPNTGKFVFQPIGCHGYEHESFTLDAGKEGPHELRAISHDMIGVINSPHSDNIHVDVSANNVVIAKLGPLQGKKLPDGSYTFEFKYRAREHVAVVLTPHAPKTVFSPESLLFHGPGDCVREGVVFAGAEGIQITGRVVPALKDVKITLQMDTPARQLATTTDEQGVFRFGPLKKTEQFQLTAEKESYVMSGPDKANTFQAHRLAQVQVTVADNSTSDKLTGVLLSLTGGEKYRKNSMTDELGERVFHSLSPGEYFLRPMMKEYKFEPSSVIIHLKDGESKKIKLTGRRVSFSVFGTVKSLNGDPEDGVALEAVGVKACDGMVEEGLSEGTGAFRIRGLLPQCDYRLQIKPDPSASVYRIAPPDLVLTTKNGDVRNVELTAFQRLERVDLSLHVSATVPDHLKTLTVKLAKETTPDSPVHVVRLDTVAGGVKQWGNSAAQERFLRPGLLVQLPFIPRDGAAYIVTVESSLSRSGHSYTEPSLRFNADAPYQALRVRFHAGVRIVEQESPKHFVAILCLAFVLFVFWQVRKGWPVLQRTSSWWAARQEAASYSARQDNSPLLAAEQLPKKKGKPRKV